MLQTRSLERHRRAARGAEQYTDDEAYDMVESFIRNNTAKLRVVAP